MATQVESDKFKDDDRLSSPSESGQTAQTDSSFSDLDESDNIFLFIPNIIGYFRIIFLFISLYYMPTHHVQASLFYVISALLDAFDGYAARHFNQSTRFGSILDQLTDRIGTLALLMVLCTLYPKYMVLFQLSAILDIASHWMYVWVTCLQGRVSHKFIDPAANPILSVYYTSRPVLFFMCAMNELFFCALYFRHFTPGPVLFNGKLNVLEFILFISGPVMVAKAFISLIHLVVASINVARIDNKERSEIKTK